MPQTEITTNQRLAYLLSTYLKPYWKQVVVLIFTYFLSSWLMVVQPLVVAPILDIVINSDEIVDIDPNLATFSLTNLDLNNIGQYVLVRLGINQLSVWEIVLVLGGIYFGVSILMYGVGYLGELISLRLQIVLRQDMQRDLYNHLMDLSIDFFNKQRTGEIVTWMENDTRNTVGNLDLIARNVIVAPIMILAYGYLLIQTDLRLTIIVVLAGVTQLGLVRLIRGPIARSTTRQRKVLADIAAYFQEIFSNIRVLKTFVAEKIEYEILNKKMKDVKKANFIYGVFKKVEDPLIGIINSLTNVAILFFIASQLINGTLTTTGFFMYLYVGRSILGPLNNLSLIYLGAQKVVSAEEKLREVFSQRPSVLPGETPISELKKGIRFEDVSFRYGHEEILSNISFDLEKGEMLALVGPSGSGKSTITDLLLRFYDPESGVIRVDGIDLRELNLEDYRRLYGSVAQESELFNSTVSENIAYAKQGLSESEIIQAAKIANAHDFIEQLPGKYETNIGDRGVMLSGGQRQRLAIARAVVRNPQLLIMDEATSSLDSVSEQQVQIAIDRVIVGTTAVVVAHRISTVKNADKILVLDKGRVIDMGKHEELYRRCEIYKKLCDLQFN